MLINYHVNCRVCNHELTSVLNLGDQCLDGLFVLPNFNPPIRKLPLELCFCNKCKLAQQRYSVDPDILYSSYGYLSSTNNQMTNHLDKIVKDVTNFFDSYTDVSCLDIGSNDNYLLKQYPERYKKTGIDPGNFSGTQDIKFINDSYPSDQLATKTYQIVTMIACFYDCNEPLVVAEAINNNLTDDGIAVVEVAYWPEKMKKGVFDELCREHVCFYSYENLEDVFNKVGLKIFRAEKNGINGGSIQIWLCKDFCYRDYTTSEYKKQITNIKLEEFNLETNTLQAYIEFEYKCRNLKIECLGMFVDLVQKGKTIHLYGASTKGNVLLQYLDTTRELNKIMLYAAERNPAKWGGLTLGTNIKIVSEEESRAMKPDYYFCSIWGFKQAVIEREQEFIKRGGKFIFPFGDNGLEVYPNG